MRALWHRRYDIITPLKAMQVFIEASAPPQPDTEVICTCLACRRGPPCLWTETGLVFKRYCRHLHLAVTCAPRCLLCAAGACQGLDSAPPMICFPHTRSSTATPSAASSPNRSQCINMHVCAAAREHTAVRVALRARQQQRRSNAIQVRYTPPAFPVVCCCTSRKEIQQRIQSPP